MPVLGLEDLEADEHLRAVGMFRREQHPSEGPYRVVRSPVSFAAPFALRHHAPRLGEQSAEILREAGYADADDIDAVIAGREQPRECRRAEKAEDRGDHARDHVLGGVSKHRSGPDHGPGTSAARLTLADHVRSPRG